MIAGVRAELLRLRRWPVTWVLAGTWLAASLTFSYVFNYLAYRSDGAGGAGQVADGAPASVLMEQMAPANVPAVLVQGMPMFGGALVMIFGALAVGSGYGWGTWKTVFTVGPRRATALAGTVSALGIVLVGLVFATFAMHLVAAFTVTALESQSATWPGVVDSLHGLGAGLLILSMWAAAGVLLGTIARGPALAVGLGLVWALVLENLLRGVSALLGPVEAVTDALPGTAAGSLAGALGALTQSEPAGTPGVLTVLDGTPAALLLGGYVLLFLVASLVLTVRRDVTA